MTSLVFPSNLPGLTWDNKRSMEWSTLSQGSVSGAETRVALWSYPRWHWELSYELLRAGSFTELQQLVSFFNSVQGSFASWLYSDPSDNAVMGQGIGTGDGATKTFQLVRAFGGSGGFAEPIYAPNVVANVYINGVVQSSSSYSVGAWGSAAPGVVTFTTAPVAGAAITVDFSWYFPCRFEGDTLDLSEFMYQLWEAKSVKFQSIKLGA